MNARLFLLAPLLLFLGGCAVSAKGADVPEIADLTSPTAAATVSEDPVEVARQLIARSFGESEDLAALQGIGLTDAGALVLNLDRPTSTLSGAELYMRYCRAVSTVVASSATSSAVTSVSVVGPTGRTIAAVTAESTQCFYR